MSTVNINVAEEFGRYTGPRFRNLGDYSGQEFRETWLQPALDAGEQVTVNLDNLIGVGSSFIEEAFGGLIRAGYPAQQVQSIKIISSQDISLIEEIRHYIEDAIVENQRISV